VTVSLDRLGTLNFMAESQIKVKFVMALTSGKRSFVGDTPLAEVMFAFAN
jgi:hypothetical protein